MNCKISLEICVIRLVKIVRECSSTILTLIIARWQRKLSPTVEEINSYVQIISAFLVLGYVIGCDMGVVIWGGLQILFFGLLLWKFAPHHLRLLDTWQCKVFAFTQFFLKLLELKITGGEVENP